MYHWAVSAWPWSSSESAESVVGNLLTHLGRGLLHPADPRTRNAIEMGHVRFDVQQRGTVENVEVLDLHMRPF